MKWNTIQISETCLPTSMRDPTTKPERPFRYVDISAIDRNLKIITSPSEITGADAPSRARKEIREGDVLVSTVRPNLNAVAIVPSELDGQIASTGFCILRPNPAILEPKYLFYFTNSSDFVGNLSSKVRGAHYPAVSDNDVKEIRMPLPPPSEQRRIVAILDEAKTLRKKRTDADRKTARILPALFYKMFGDPATNPKRWNSGTLGDVIIESQYGTSTPANVNGEGVPVVRMNNIDPDGYLNLNDLKCVVLSETDVKAYSLFPGDILFNRTNTTELVGKTGLWRLRMPAVAASYLIRVRVDQTKALPEFIWAYMNCPFIKQTLLNMARRAIGMANINARELRSLPLLIPSKDQQMSFAKHLSGIEELRDKRNRSDKNIEQLFMLLLHRAFTGDLTAKWREAHKTELLAEMEGQARLLEVSSVSA
jgi:type I restriction enzyme S subunit